MARHLLGKSISFLLFVKLIVILVVLVYAATMLTTTFQRSGESGNNVTVANDLLPSELGSSKASSGLTAAGTSCVNNVTFTGTAGTANAAVTSGDYVYAVQVNTTATTPASKCFAVTLIVYSNNGSPTNYSPVYIATGSTVTAGQTITCKFDIGTSLPPSNYSFKFIVQ